MHQPNIACKQLHFVSVYETQWPVREQRSVVAGKAGEEKEEVGGGGRGHVELRGWTDRLTDRGSKEQTDMLLEGLFFGLGL